ncbi:radical SAM protein [Candidatus Albibeggiatoa sp. nov. BB20]|uniref:B12-binding domain-containing radical SAM protein n=1 Tax=Candidatus Albibeggiatoa sp. nov. BB20 TaxID=3162723 RepID=UPI0033658A57
MTKIFCISAGQLIVKKADNIINRRNRYLNYGLLSLATELKEAGFDTIQIQGNFDAPKKTLQTCKQHGIEYTTSPILISIPSFYAIPWVNEFISIVRSIKLKQKIIIGGRWVINDHPEFLRKLIPDADLIVSGIANGRIIDIVRGFDFPQNKPSNSYPRLDYTLLHERNLYQPSIEISRGCGKMCTFCQEKNEKLQPLKQAQLVINEAKEIILNDNLKKMSPYFEASTFAPNGKWAEQLSSLIYQSSLDLKWRAEARVDSILPKRLEVLSKAGLKVLDLGLESASPRQLIRMKKTENPSIYLSKASDLLKAAFDHNIWVKINILISAGESCKSIEQTINWLDLHSKYIKGISAGPLIIFGLEHSKKYIIDEIENYGATLSHSPTDGVTNINPSKEINYKRSIEISQYISKRHMNADDYYQLKSFSYFSRDYEYNDFITDILSTNTILSFDTTEIKCQAVAYPQLY